MDTIVALVDCNSFYASCEQVFRPGLKGKPVAVLSNNDGCVVAASAEAKALGIKIGVPAFQCEKMIRDRGGELFSSNYALYGDMSRRVIETLAQFAGEIEQYSIDEAFLDLTEFRRLDLVEYGRKIRATVGQWTGIPVSVGIAGTKTLAKVANRVAKTNGEYGGVFSLVDHPDIDEVLKRIEVGDVWGIGCRRAQLLHSAGIHNACSLKYAGDNWIRKQMSVAGLRTVMELRGHPCTDMELSPPPKKNIGSSRSFGFRVESLDDLKEAVSAYVSTAAMKLRSQKSVASALTVFIMTDRFKPIRTMPIPVRSCCRLRPHIRRNWFPPHWNALKRSTGRVQIQKSGVLLGGVIPEDQAQLSLFLAPDNGKKISAMRVLDSINRRYGAHALQTGSEGIKKAWSMKQALLSPRYTTRWDELLVI
jgi:DNA polymerase V